MTPDNIVTLDRLRQLVGEVDAARLAEILRLEPSIAEVEEAAIRADGSADLHWACEGKVARIVEILTAEPEEEP